MNLNLIRKYEKEFLHMLHGGKVIFKPNDKQVWFDSTESPIDWTVEGLYVIDDMYSPYRTALAEGKTVQYRTKYSNWIDYKDNNGINCNIFSSNKSVASCYEYRIKPKEPEFKVGDYVRYIHANSPKPLQIVNINCERYYFENAKIILRVDEIEKWEPREDEVCIFWNNGSNTAVIAKLRYIVSTGTYRTEHSYWDNCMPFTGTLPPHMKVSK